MRLKLVCVGQKMPAWVTEGFRDYARRMPRELPLELTEIAMPHRGKNPDINRLMRQEAEAVLSATAPDDHVIAMEVGGRAWSTEDLAGQLSNWQLEGRDLCFLVGGPDGLHPVCRERANQQWSLSPLTLPHPLVRILLAEQLYRAWTITRNHPYHRA